MKRAFLPVLFTLLSGYGAIAQHTADYGHNSRAGRYYAVRGIKLYVESYGRGAPLLLIHGNGGDISAFGNNIPELEKYYRVIAVDSRAQGKSVDTGDSLSFEMMADDFAALLDQMHLDSVYVIGWSDGGINALVLAMRHPGKVKKLVASGANLWPDSTAIVPSVWLDGYRQFQEGRHHAWTTRKEKNDWKIFLLDYDQPHISLAGLEKVHCPALIVAGDHDVIRLDHTVQIYRHIPRAYLWIVPDSGHGTLIEHADAFNRKVRWFFSTPYHPR